MIQGMNTYGYNIATTYQKSKISEGQNNLDKQKSSGDNFASMVGKAITDVIDKGKSIETKVQSAVRGESNIEDTIPDVAALGLEVESASKVIESASGAIRSLLSIQI